MEHKEQLLATMTAIAEQMIEYLERGRLLEEDDEAFALYHNIKSMLDLLYG